MDAPACAPPTDDSRRCSGIILLAVAVLLAAASGAVLIHTSTTRSPTPALAPPLPQANPPAAAPTSPSAPATSPSTTAERTNPLPQTGASPPEHAPDPLAGPLSDQALDAELHQQLPSDLPSWLEQHLVATASAVVLADLAGRGREAFPRYLPGQVTTGQLHTEVRIQAAVARSYRGMTDLAEVTLLWAGSTPVGEYVERRHSQLRLELRDGTWQPLTP